MKAVFLINILCTIKLLNIAKQTIGKMFSNFEVTKPTLSVVSKIDDVVKQDHFAEI